MKGHTVPFIDSVRRDLQNVEERRIYLQGAVEDLLSGDPSESAITLHLFFEATCGYALAGEVIGMTAEQVEFALRDSTSLTLQQFGQLIQFALRKDKLQVASQILSAVDVQTQAIERQAA